MPTTRDAVAEAFDEVSASGAAEAEPVQEAPPEVEAAAEEGGESAAGAEKPGADGDKARDEKGRFAAAAKAKEAAKETAKEGQKPAQEAAAAEIKPPGQEAAAAAPGAVAEPVIKAPAAWTPAEREEWDKLPLKAKQAFARVETATKKALQDAAGERQLASAFQKTVAPYESMMRQAGAQHPLQVVEGLLKFAHDIRTVPPQQRAQMIAGVVQQFLGTDERAIDMLAAALQGQPAKPGQSAQPVALDPEAIVAQAEERLMKRISEQTNKRLDAQAQQDAIAFGQKNEFFNDVKADMGALLGSGLAEDLESAYKMALALPKHAEIAAVLKQREAGKAHANAQASTQRSRAAASSLKNEPAGITAPPKPKNTREAVEQSWKELEGR